jgi:hypothetical protein
VAAAAVVVLLKMLLLLMTLLLLLLLMMLLLLLLLLLLLQTRGLVSMSCVVLLRGFYKCYWCLSLTSVMEDAHTYTANVHTHITSVHVHHIYYTGQFAAVYGKSTWCDMHASETAKFDSTCKQHFDVPSYGTSDVTASLKHAMLLHSFDKLERQPKTRATN